MQCPACNNDYEAADFGEPARCPGCGVYYEKAMALKQRRLAAQAEAEKAESSAASDSLGKLAGALKGAKLAVSEGRRERELEQKRIEEAHSVSAARPVVVVDIKMGFWSMVVFMVKWTLAAIPAFLILAAIGVFVVSFATGFIGSYGKYASKSAAESKADVQPVPEAADRVLTSPERIAVPGSVAGSFWLYKLGEVGGMVKMIVRTDFAGGSQSFSEFVVNCSAARGMIISVGSSAQEMRPDPGATGFEEIRPNTPRHAIAARGCRDRPDKHPTFK